ncbi:Chaperonin GroEL [Pseudomonas syringae pv. actinidiae]|uniref:Chaperonin GroEL n=1 Tax=Pseudomonas syringae pv. actinidiae TaxID=103796 RepID=A0A2V0QH95_PSESF|nr:Chaperonin GroEL [Pseudomonas syringae pv. actinidiae]
MLTHPIDNLLPLTERLAVHRNQAITCFKPGALSRPLRVDLCQHRQQGRTPRTDAQRFDRIRLFSTFEPVTEHQLARGIDRRALIPDLERDGTAFAKAANQLQIDPGPARCRLAIDSDNFLPGSQTGLLSNTAGLDGTDDRANLLAAHHRQHPEERDGQQEVGGRACDHDRNSLPYGLAVERLISQLRRNIAFALVEHLHVAAQRNRSDDVLSPLTITPAQQRRAEAYRKTQHLDATAPGHPEVAKLVKGHQHAQRNKGAENHI